MKMKTITPLLLGALFSAGALAQAPAPADSGTTTPDKQTAQKPGAGMGAGYGCGMHPGMMYGMHPGMYGMHPGMMGMGMGPGMMGYGMGPGMMGPGMMGYGPGTMGGYGMGPGMGYGMGPGMMGVPGYGRIPDLTPDQRKQISKIQDETRKKNWELMGQLMDEQARLRDQYEAPKQDANAVANAQKRINELQRQMYDDATKAHERMEAVLSKEQKGRN